MTIFRRKIVTFFSDFVKNIGRGYTRLNQGDCYNDYPQSILEQTIKRNSVTPVKKGNKTINIDDAAFSEGSL